MDLKHGAARRPSRAAVDAVMDAYVAWREASVAVSDAYGRWSAAGSAERAGAYAAYVAALDREEFAARCYRRVLARVSSVWDAAGAEPGLASVDRAA